MKHYIKVTLLLLLPFFTKAQQQQKQLNSLHTALSNAADDSIRVLQLTGLAIYYLESNRDSAMFFNDKALAIAKKLNQPLGVARLLLIKAYLVQKQANFSLSLKLCNEALAIVQDEKNERNVYIPKEDEFASSPRKYRISITRDIYHQLGNTWSGAGNKEKAIENYKKVIQVANELNSKSKPLTSYMNIGSLYQQMNQLDTAFIYSTRALEYVKSSGYKTYEGYILSNIGTIYFKKGMLDSAKHYYQNSLLSNKEQNNVAGEITSNIALARLYQKLAQADSLKYYASAALQLATVLKMPTGIDDAANLLSVVFKMQGNADSALFYLTLSKNLGDSLHRDITDKLTQFQNTNFEEQMQLEKEAQASTVAKNKIRTIALFAGLVLLSILAFVFYRNNKQKQRANTVLEKTLTGLKQTQSQLIQSEKMASLGELTAGIAHEIQNPLNFVNNFSEVSNELIAEMKDELEKGDIEEAKAIANDVQQNLEKINHHGKRAADIVKGMLQHSRSSSGVKEPTDINALCDEYLRLSYHGLRAKDKTFNATMKTDFDNSIGNINIIPQDIGRVVLNLINNAFYAVNEKQKQNISGYEPTVEIKTTQNPLSGGRGAEIRVTDNGNGIPQKVLDKIFQPFFTTKPTGQGTGLGLSLSYDIVKAHGGELKVETKESEGTIFIIQLPTV